MNNLPIVNPQKFIAYLRQTGRLNNVQPPQTVIMIFLESLLMLCQEHHSLTKVNGFDAGDLYLLDENKAIGIFFCKGIGAPIAVINLEELVAFGVKQFLVVGTAGSLQKHLPVGEIVLCNSAIIDEGTSKHYSAEPSSLAKPESTWHLKLKNYLAQTSLQTLEGTSWTTDAPYRETTEKVLSLQRQNVLCVEMEISALFTVAEFNKVSLSAAFVMSDSLADLAWTPGFFSSKVTESLCALLNGAIAFAKISLPLVTTVKATLEATFESI